MFCNPHLSSLEVKPCAVIAFIPPQHLRTLLLRNKPDVKIGSSGSRIYKCVILCMEAMLRLRAGAKHKRPAAWCQSCFLYSWFIQVNTATLFPDLTRNLAQTHVFNLCLQDSLSMLARMFDANWAGKNRTDDKVRHLPIRAYRHHNPAERLLMSLSVRSHQNIRRHGKAIEAAEGIHAADTLATVCRGVCSLTEILSTLASS